MFGSWDRFNLCSRLAQKARRGQPDLCEVGRGHEEILRSLPIGPHAWAACLPLCMYVSPASSDSLASGHLRTQAPASSTSGLWAPTHTSPSLQQKRVTTPRSLTHALHVCWDATSDKLITSRIPFLVHVQPHTCLARKSTPYIHTHLPCTQHRAAFLAIQFVEERFADRAAVGVGAGSPAQQLGQQPSCINVRCIPVQTRHTHVHTNVRTHVCRRPHVYTKVRTYLRTHTYICTYIHRYMHSCARTHDLTCMHVRTHIHTCIRT